MRCAIDFDENKPLMEQEVRAWGEMQSLKEEPCYKESDIKNINAKKFFFGYKCAFDDVCNILMNLEFDETISKEVSEHIQVLMSGDLCMQLFSILDDEYCEEDDEADE